MQGETPFTIGIYAASTQGLYFGELVNQVRQLSTVRGYRCVLINTASYAAFDCALGTSGIDAFIIIKNSVSSAQAEFICNELQKPCVSIGYDYFPLKIPVIASDHELGVKLAVDELILNGHQHIAFIGDLSHYDIRKRYEAYCDLLEQYDLPSRDDYLFNTHNALFSGGHQVATEFLERECDATAVLAGAGLTGVGFYQRLSELNPELATRLSVTCFDAIPLIPVLTPDLTAVDPNLHLIAWHAVAELEAIRNSEAVPQKEKVQPRLIKVTQDPKASYSEFLANCADLSGFHTPNYMKTITANISDWSEDIVQSDLDRIMSIAPLFRPYISACVLSKWCANGQLQVLKHIRYDVQKQFSADQQPVYSAADFGIDPVNALTQQNGDLCCHFALFVQNRLWGFISVVGDSRNTSNASSFFAFTGVLEIITRRYQDRLTIAELSQTRAPAPAALSTSARIYWDIKNGLTTWSEEALRLLGFSSKLDLHIYQNMDITDRVHSDDLALVREQLTRAAQGASSECHFRIKPKKGPHRQAVLRSETAASDAEGIAFIFGAEAAGEEDGL